MRPELLNPVQIHRVIHWNIWTSQIYLDPLPLDRKPRFIGRQTVCGRL